MESFFKLNVEQRETTGNSAARSLRRNGKVPANYYYKGESNQNLSIDKKTLHKAIQSGQQVFEMELDGNVIYVTFKAAQYHPVTEEIMHIDLPEDTELVSAEDTTIAVCAPPTTEVETETADEDESDDSTDTPASDTESDAQKSGEAEDASSETNEGESNNEEASSD